MAGHVMVDFCTL